MKSFFPDVNVWIALAYRGHQHHPSANAWFSTLGGHKLYFCRFTQVAFLRLLTYPAVMHDEVMTQREAWRTYDMLCSDGRVTFQSEADASQVGSIFRRLTSTARPSSRQWVDAYLAAFGLSAGLALVTFDRALHAIAGRDAVLLT